MTSNQGRDISQVLAAVSREDLEDVAAVIRLEISRHPAEATCECPAIEAIARLYEMGYRLVDKDRA